MIVFTKIRWKNLLSTGNNPTEIQLNLNRNTILLGASGSGKSTFLDAISFVLFNRPFRNINKNQLVNSINQKNCLVEIEFSIGDQNYLIKRGLKPNVFEIYCNSSLVNQDSHTRDYQQFLEKNILKFNFKAFTQIVVLGASNFTPFMRLKPSDRRIIIEGLLDIEIFSAMNAILKQRISTLKSLQQDVENQILLTNDRIAIQKKYLVDISQDRQNKIDQNLRTIETHKTEMASLQKDVENFELMIKDLQTKMHPKSDLSEQMQKIRIIKDRVESNIKKAEKEILFYEKTDLCSTCNQSIPVDFKKSEISKKHDKIEEWQKGLIDVGAAVSKLDLKLSHNSDIENQIQNIESNAIKTKTKIAGIHQFIKKLFDDTLKLKSSDQNFDDAQSKLDDLASTIVNLEKTRESYAFQRHVQDHAVSLLKDSGVKTKIIKQYLPIINKHTNLFLNAMNFFVMFNLDDEFNESIKSRGRDDFSYENFSEGEKQRIDLALLFTWRTIAKLKNSVNTNLLIMDEILDSYLDTEATENVLQLLSSAMFSDSNIFVISHKETISDKFSKTIHFTKVKNFSIMN